MRYCEHSASSIETMLKVTNKKSLSDLFSSIPSQLRLKHPLNVPEALDEQSLKRLLVPLAMPTKLTSFLGAGATAHFVPEWVSQQLMRAEWYTSYTPYQPELSQGTLQAIFEFQSIVSSLMGLEVANASLYDGATALVEALLMAVRIKNKKTVLLSTAIHPEYREVVRTYLSLADIQVLEASFTTDGSTDLHETKNKAHDVYADLAAIAVQSPNFFGIVEDIQAFSKLAHDYRAFLIGIQTDMSASALLSSMGKLGTDIAVGEGLGFLPGLNLGGPGVGLMATHRSLVRQMPGRLVGYTEDANNNPGYVLTLSTREQHIRREKATSNICTNHNLMALAFAMSMVAYGSMGLRTLALINLKKTLFFRECLRKHGKGVAFSGPHYNESVLAFKTPEVLERCLREARRQQIIAGLKLSCFYPSLDRHLLVCTTELIEDKSIKLLADILGSNYEDR